ncbi:HEPN domain-containing protein [Yoonia maritima]|uniref:HEPN domain-containing protein n=1 Tax=Yoonia maritima TaxID=1435347 RepID=UPI000D05959A
MFAVTIVATYEGIVKSTLMEYASKVHPKYLKYVEGDFHKSNARISGDDLKAYSVRFGLSRWEHAEAPKNATTYHRIIAERRPVVERRFRKDMMGSYTNLFQWRNAYAHERSTSATLLDVYESHRVAQYVVGSFVKAFEEG